MQDYGGRDEEDLFKGTSGQKLMYTKDQIAEMEDEAKPKADPLEGIPTFHEFTQATKFHGVAYIFMGTFRIRK